MGGSRRRQANRGGRDQVCHRSTAADPVHFEPAAQNSYFFIVKTFHHIGIPTTTPRPGETCLEEARLHITDPEASEHRIEWLRFEDDSPLPEVLKTTAHVAFVVDDLDAALAGQDVLLEPFTPMEGVRVAFIMDDGAPVEFMQLDA